MILEAMRMILCRLVAVVYTWPSRDAPPFHVRRASGAGAFCFSFFLPLDSDQVLPCLLTASSSV